jgi:hypothetical protein
MASVAERSEPNTGEFPLLLKTEVSVHAYYAGNAALGLKKCEHWPYRALVRARTLIAVEQVNQKAPQGDELEATLGEMIVPRRRSVAPGTDGCRFLPWSDVHFDAFVVGSKACVLVDKSAMMMAVI